MSEPEDKAYIAHLENEIAKLRAQIKELEMQIESLKKEKGLSGAASGLEFNPRTGTHIEESTSKHFCTVCLSNDNRRELKLEPHGWRCVICRNYYEDPDRPEPSPDPGDDY